MRRRAVLALLVTCASAGCGPERIPPPEMAAPSLGDPSAAIPGDLDVAVRIDLGRIKRTLGAPLIESLRARAAKSGEGRDPATAELLADVLAASDSLWVAFRPGLSAEHTDNVLIARGDFERIDPQSYRSDPKWRSPEDLGGGWRLYERDKPHARSLPARIYAHVSDLMVFVSTAEIDSVERSLEQRMDDARVSPPAEGVLSIEARAPALAEQVLERSPAAARLLKRASKLRAHADLSQTGFDAELELVLDSESGARETAEAAALFAKALGAEGGGASALVKGLKIEAVGETVVARLSLAHAELAEVLPELEPAP